MAALLVDFDEKNPSDPVRIMRKIVFFLVRHDFY